jgi:hypothetical protein
MIIDSDPSGTPTLPGIHDSTLSFEKSRRARVYPLHIINHIQKRTIIASVIVELFLRLEQPAHLASSDAFDMIWHASLSEFSNLRWDVFFLFVAVFFAIVSHV